MGNIIWLASYPKSGNTWMRAFIHNLFRDPDKPLNINEIGGGMLTTGDAVMDWYKRLDPRPPEQWTRKDIDAMRPKVHRLIADNHPGTIFCKTHCAILHMRGQPTVNMDVTAGAIYIVRNPLDIVLSFADFQGVDIDKAITVLGTHNCELPNDKESVSEPLGSWSQNTESWTAKPNPRLHLVRYEDMLEAPMRTFAAVTRFLGVDAPQARIERAVESSSFKVMREQEDKFGFNERSPAQERFFRKGTAGHWKDELNDGQVERIVSRHREQMQRFGYVPDGF